MQYTPKYLYLLSAPKEGACPSALVQGSSSESESRFFVTKYPEDGSNFNRLRTGRSNIINTTITSNWYTTTYDSIIIWKLAQIGSSVTRCKVSVTRAEFLCSTPLNWYITTYHSIIIKIWLKLAHLLPNVKFQSLELNSCLQHL